MRYRKLQVAGTDVVHNCYNYNEVGSDPLLSSDSEDTELLSDDTAALLSCGVRKVSRLSADGMEQHGVLCL